MSVMSAKYHITKIFPWNKGHFIRYIFKTQFFISFACNCDQVISQADLT